MTFKRGVATATASKHQYQKMTIRFSFSCYNVDLLEYELCNLPDTKFVSYLCTGLRHGFDTLVQSEKVQTKECKNNLSARVQETVVSELIDKELQKGFIYGPFTQPPFDNYRVSPIGVAEGKYSKKKRLILNLSAPHNDTDLSINDLIDKAQCSMSYIKIDDAIKNYHVSRKW